MKLTSTNKIRRIRLKKEYSQGYVAYILGISQKSYSNIENGNTLLHQRHLEKLCQLYDVKPSYFCNLAYQCNKNTRLNKILKYIKENDIDMPTDI